MATHSDRERFHPESAEARSAWLEANHDRTDGVGLVTRKVAAGRLRVTYEESVVEALAVGWVGSPGSRLEDERCMLWFSPRKPTSGSRRNKERIELLEREGRMLAAGRRAVDIAEVRGSWSLLDDVENLVVPVSLALAFEEHPGAKQSWDAISRSARRGIRQWMVQAKTAATRAKRVAEAAEKASRGERANRWLRA